MPARPPMSCGCQNCHRRVQLRLQLAGDGPRRFAFSIQGEGPLLTLPVDPRPARLRTRLLVGTVDPRKQFKPFAAGHVLLNAHPQLRPPPACLNTDGEGCSSRWMAIAEEDARPAADNGTRWLNEVRSPWVGAAPLTVSRPPAPSA